MVWNWVAAILLKLFGLTLGSKSLQMNASPLGIVSLHHCGHRRNPSAGAGAFHSAANCCCSLQHSLHHWGLTAGPPPSRNQSREGRRLTAAPSAVASALSAACWGHWANEHQGTARSRNTWLGSISRFPRKTQTQLLANCIYFSHKIYISIESKISTDQTCNLQDN